MNILIVDDEPALVEYLTTTVNAYYPGHRVRGALSGTDAIGAAYEEGAVDLLIADVNLGDTDGFQVRSQLEPIFPEMQTIFISGAPYAMPDADALASREILRKPLGTSEIFGVVEAAQQRIRPRITTAVALCEPVSRSVSMVAADFPIGLRHRGQVVAPMPQGMPTVRAREVNAPEPRRPERIWLPAALSLLALGCVLTLAIRDARLRGPAAEGEPTGKIARMLPADRVQLRELPAPLPATGGTPAPPAAQPPVTLSDPFEGSDRPLSVEPQWRVLPMAQGASEILVGEGSVRARSSDRVIALFAAASVSPRYDWSAEVSIRASDSAGAGLVFGYRNPEDYYAVAIDPSKGAFAVIRRFAGETETLAEGRLPDGEPTVALHASYDGPSGELTVGVADDGIPAKLNLPEFEGGHFGLLIPPTPLSRFSDFALRLVPRI